MTQNKYKKGMIVRSSSLEGMGLERIYRYYLILEPYFYETYDVWWIDGGKRIERMDLTPVSTFTEEVIYDPV